MLTQPLSISPCAAGPGLVVASRLELAMMLTKIRAIPLISVDMSSVKS
jgi:hypothetical protein